MRAPFSWPVRMLPTRECSPTAKGREGAVDRETVRLGQYVLASEGGEMNIHVLFKFAPNPYGGVEIDTTSSSGQWRDLSPFVLGPIDLPDIHAENFENLWQFSKVYYPEHVDRDYNPNHAWFEWRQKGFADKRAHRYPMGKGRKPLYSMWEGQKLGYIEARKTIYAPVYAQFVRRTESFWRLEELYRTGATIIL